VRVSGALVFSQVVSGDGHSGALAAGGQAWCWGNNTNGELGDGTTVSSNSPVLVAGGMNFTQLSSSGIHVCALDTTGAAGAGATGTTAGWATDCCFRV
jgi:alpha-tubulin suppressor-like RCC1 family protein